MTYILGLSGKSGSGKSTLASFLFRNQSELFGLNKVSQVRVYSPADLCKKYLVEQFGVQPEILYQDKTLLTHLPVPDGGEARFMTGRKLLRFWYDLVYRMDPLASINAVLRRISEDGPRLAVVEGVRSQEEVGGIKEAGGRVVRLEGRRRGGDKFSCHASETSLDSFTDWDLVLDTSRPRQETCQSLVAALRDWGWVS